VIDESYGPVRGNTYTGFNQLLKEVEVMRKGILLISLVIMLVGVFFVAASFANTTITWWYENILGCVKYFL